MKKFIVNCTIAAFTVLECGVLTSCDQDSDVNDQWGNSEILSLANKKKTLRSETSDNRLMVTGGSIHETYNSNDSDSITIKTDKEWYEDYVASISPTVSVKVTHESSKCTVDTGNPWFSICNDRATITYTVTVKYSNKRSKLIPIEYDTSVTTYIKDKNQFFM